jgi:hypothetical protein
VVLLKMGRMGGASDWVDLELSTKLPTGRSGLGVILATGGRVEP